ncbi:GGDEF domain-containing protein [Nakamurella endophytica]|uniref:GGDEF domain-containing protein n=1 Tax=Nakamurella endophytica TaxID=1748367 RepID=A0A917WJI8_9ACTN|nr:GGDEF domain-containing protein [Nakamurella endophytica]
MGQQSADGGGDPLADLRGRLAEQTALRVQAEASVAVLTARVRERERILRAAQELARVGDWSWDLRTGHMYWSEQVHRLVGLDPATSPADFDRYMSMVVDEDRDSSRTHVLRAAETGEDIELEHRVLRADGSVREMSVRGLAERDAAGTVVKLTGSIQDVTEIRQAARDLRRSRDLFAGVLDAATQQSIVATDPRGRITVFNRGAERMLGWLEDDVLGTSHERLHDPDELAERAGESGLPAGHPVVLARAATGEAETRRWTLRTRDGRRRCVEVSVTAMPGPGGTTGGFILVGTDITERLAAEQALRESESRFQDMFRYAPNGMMLIRLGSDVGRFSQVNAALCRLTGYSEEQLLQMRVVDLTADEEKHLHVERFGAMAAGQPAETTAERHWVRADGQDLWVQFSVTPRAGSTDSYLIGQVEDITARRQAEARLTHQALHDGLTGLPNRILLTDRIEHALASAKRSGHAVGVLYLDLDGFKSINDTAGHAAGDDVLVQVAGRLTRALRPGDTVARLGGDEFVVVCETLDDVTVAQRIAQRILDAVRRPYQHGNQVLRLSASVGICLSETDGTSTAAQLLNAADQAMYRAKDAGRDRIRVSGVDDPDHAARSARAARTLRLQRELTEAVARDEFFFVGQPVHHVDSGRVAAVETLIRWRHPDRGVLGPGEFLDVAESGDHILAMGRRALSESCRMAGDWVRALGPAAPPVHVNVSGRQLESGNLHDDVLAELEAHGLPPAQLVLELTETHMPLLADSLRKDLLRLREHGVMVAIDDLGTGYSSLSRITELPVDILKIDVSFVAGILTDQASAAVARGIVAIGEGMGLSVIAEGVETPEQATTLRGYGCGLVQGYHYSRPLPEDALMDYLRAHNGGAQG